MRSILRTRAIRILILVSVVSVAIGLPVLVFRVDIVPVGFTGAAAMGGFLAIYGAIVWKIESRPDNKWFQKIACRLQGIECVLDNDNEIAFVISSELAQKEPDKIEHFRNTVMNEFQLTHTNRTCFGGRTPDGDVYFKPVQGPGGTRSEGTAPFLAGVGYFTFALAAALLLALGLKMPLFLLLPLQVITGWVMIFSLVLLFLVLGMYVCQEYNKYKVLRCLGQRNTNSPADATE